MERGHSVTARNVASPAARRIVITGGSSGIGQGIARRLSGPEARIASIELADGSATGQTLLLDGGFMATGLGYLGAARTALTLASNT